MKDFKQIAVKINSKEEYKKSKKLFKKLGYKNDKKWNELYVDKIGGVIKYNLGFESGMFSMHSSCVNFKTFKSIKEFKEYVKSKEPKKGKLTIIVSKNYKELYEDNLALVNHILLDTVKNDKQWVENVQKSNLNITLYTDKNDTELFRKSFGKFEVKLMDCEVNTSPLGKAAIVRKEELVSGWYKVVEYPIAIIYFNKSKEKHYGIGYLGDWATEIRMLKEYTYELCSHEEVKERLKEEAIKRGFKKGVKTEYGKIYEEDFSLKDNNLWMEDQIIMNNGKWTEIVEEELTLENIQVDCSDLTTEQIEEMKRVVVDNGYKLWNSFCAFEIIELYNLFRISRRNDMFAIYDLDENKTTITYDKFMELFDTKKEECNNNLKGLVLVSHKGVDKSRLQEPEYVEQMIKKGKISHAENFNKSLVMDNGSTISNVKKGEAKSIEELHVEHRDNNSIGKSDSKEDLFLSVESKPKQYQIGIDTFERAKANLTKEEYLACLKFGIDKYTWRLKGKDIEDFEKIIAYANEAINVLKSKK